MKKRKNKKKKIIKFLGVLAILSLLVMFVLNIRIKNIYIKGNKLLSDQEIIELAGIEKYPKLFSISSIKIKNKIKMNPIVESVIVNKNIFGRIDIKVQEYNLILKDETDKGIYLTNGKKLTIDEPILGIPSLINVVEEDILKDFLKKLDKVDKNILANISETVCFTSMAFTSVNILLHIYYIK